MVLIEEANTIDIICFGTPKIYGDALGPIIGSMLQLHRFEKDVKIIGTLKDPVTVTTARRKIQEIRTDTTVVAIDACVGDKPGTYEIIAGPLYPGSALSNRFGAVGHVSIKGYTGTTIGNVVRATEWDVVLLAYTITTELLDLLVKTKNNVYIEI